MAPTAATETGGQTFIGGRRASRLQEDKYRRVLEAAHQLADEGGFDAVQMRKVADRSGVALATIYRYFSSRDMLAYVVSQRWANQVVARGRRSRPADDPLAQVIGQVRSSARALHRHPRLLETWARASLTSDPEVVAMIRDRISTVSLSAMPRPDGVDQQAWLDLLVLIDAVFYAGLIRWSHGQKAFSEIPREVEAVVRACAAAGSGERPAVTLRRPARAADGGRRRSARGSSTPGRQR